MPRKKQKNAPATTLFLKANIKTIAWLISGITKTFHPRTLDMMKTKECIDQKIVFKPQKHEDNAQKKKNEWKFLAQITFLYL